MPINPTATMVFTDFQVIDDVGVRLHFVSPNPGAGENSDYYVTLTDAEIAGVTTLAALKTLVQTKLNRRLNAAGLGARLTTAIGQSFTLGGSGT